MPKLKKIKLIHLFQYIWCEWFAAVGDK